MDNKIISNYTKLVSYHTKLIKNCDDKELVDFAKKSIVKYINILYKKEQKDRRVYEKMLEEVSLDKSLLINIDTKDNSSKDINISKATNYEGSKTPTSLQSEERYIDQKIRLNNGIEMPKVVFGTWRMWDEQSEGYNPTLTALKLGCRAIDTAQAYNTERGVGLAIKDSNIPRNEIFLSSKFEPDFVNDYSAAKISFENTLKNLQTSYIDIMYIHAPASWDRKTKNDNVGIYKLLEEELEKGRIRGIGLSNFNVAELKELMKHIKVKPVAIQCSSSIGNKNYEDLIAFCKENNIQVIPYSPIASGYLLDSPQLKTMAQAKGISTAQLCLDYVGQKHGCYVFGSENALHIKENILTKKTLNNEDLTLLNGINDDKTMWSYEESFKKNPIISSVRQNVKQL